MIRFYALVPGEELEQRKLNRPGGHSVGTTHLPPNPAASINISSWIFISSHSPSGFVYIQSNGAQRIWKLLYGDAKINFYEPSCSRNTVWHFKWWHISILWGRCLQEGIHWSCKAKRTMFFHICGFCLLWAGWWFYPTSVPRWPFRMKDE